MRELFRLSVVAVSVLALISLLVFVAQATILKKQAWLCEILGSGRSRYYSMPFKVRAYLFLAAGAFLVGIYGGGRYLLWWMPSSWGSYTGEGEWVSLRSFVAGLAVPTIGLLLLNCILDAIAYWQQTQFLLLEYKIADLERKGLEKLVEARGSKKVLEFHGAGFRRELEKHRACGLAGQNPYPGISDCPGLREHQWHLIIDVHQRLIRAAEEGASRIRTV